MRDDHQEPTLAESSSAMAALPDGVIVETVHDNRLSWESMGLIVLLAMVWGSSFILMKRSLTYFGPIEVGGIRMVMAGAFMLPLALIRFRRIRLKDVPLMMTSGVVGSFIPAFLFATAGQYIDSGISGSLNGLSPLFTLLLGILFFNAHTTWKGYAGIFIGLLGALALSLVRVGADAELNSWALLVVLATFMYGININLVKYYLNHVDAITITSVALVPIGIAGAIVLAFLTPFFSRVSLPGFWGLPLACGAILGVFGSAVSIILYNRLLKQVSALVASTVTYLMPVVSLCWGVWDGEQIKAWQYVGLAMVLGGMGLVAAGSRKIKMRNEK